MRAFVRLGRPLRHLVSVACRRPAVTVAVWLSLAAVMLGWSLVALRFETSSLRLLPRTARYVTLYEEYSRNFGELDDVLIVVESGDPARSVTFAEGLVERLRRGKVRFHRLAYRVDPEDFSGRRLLYLTLDELNGLRRVLLDHEELITSFAARPGLETLIANIRRRVDGAILMGLFDLGLDDHATGDDLNVLRELIGELHRAVDGHEGYRSPWAAMFPRQPDTSEGVFLSEDKRLLFMFADPVAVDGGFAADREAVEEIRRQIVELRADFPDVQAGVTGGPALASDEMTTAFHDSEIATLLAFALTLGVLILAFRQVVKPLLMLLVLGVSVVVSIGVVTLTVGHLTIFSVMFISMVVGLGIDYGIYVLFRYEEARAALSPRAAVAFTAERSGPGIVLGGLSAVVTFYVLMLTTFRGIQEFGFVAGSALLIALGAMLTLFPALLVLLDSARHPRSAVTSPRPETVFRALSLAAERPVLVLTAAVLASCLAGWQARHVRFDYNLMNLQARSSESVRWEQKIVEGTTRSAFGALDTARSLPELREKADAFRRLPSVAGVDSALMLLPERQPEKLAALSEMKPLWTSLRLAEREAPSPDRVIAEIQKLANRLAFIADQASRHPAGNDVRRLKDEVERLAVKAAHTGGDVLARRLESFDRQLYDDFRRTVASLSSDLTAAPMTPETLPEQLRRKFVGKDGRYLLEIYPRVNTWERGGAQRFVEELRSVAPDVTGTPVVSYESIRLMETAYRTGTLYAFLLVSALTALLLGTGRYTALALVPFLLGTLWAVGLMPVFGLTFNLSNVWGLPLIIGASAEYGLNLVVRFLEARAHGGTPFARSTVSAVLLSGVTTMVGFVSLLVAHHRGIWSLGLLLTLGSCTGLAASLLVLPALLRRFERTDA
jgi:uncharacterized protein